MIERKLEKTIIHSLTHFSVVGLLGSRQTGKTTLAHIIQKQFPESIYIDLELPSDANKLQEPELYLRQFEKKLVILDEIQRMPELFPILRSLVDQKRRPGRFLVLGSASPERIKNASETLAGRIVYHELSPFLIEETGTNWESVIRLWLRGGYPDSFLAPTDEISFQWREAFIRTYLERDIPQLGFRIPSLRLRRFWTMVAHYHGHLWNASQISNSLDVTSPMVKIYLDILHDSFVVRQLLPYFANVKKRLVKKPKVYLRDTGLLHALLHISSFDALQSHPALGNSFEGFAIEQIIHTLPEQITPYFYRTNAGAEIDLILTEGNCCLAAIEIKYSLNPRLGKGFYNAFADLNCSMGIIVYPGDEIYPINKKIFLFPVTKIPVLYDTIKKRM